ncbi:HpcH/HpaI aldolase/citrate lyase family protein [Phycicoccus avicenniae]|uniref:HpcH/HpaI aldolase/citrate lyase family protein n=1 Tax=Phycicoccus avicenniae TaxID=2828860 RepID=UPI003D290537
MAGVPLTWLYVPADRADRVEKALASAADVVVLDLEDAVAPAAKDAARATARAVASDAGRPLQVRVNGFGTPWHDDDLALVAGLPREVGLRLPKAQDPAMVRSLARRLRGRPLHLLVESARGVEDAGDLAAADPAVASIGLGEADLRAELAVTDDSGLLWARSRLVVAAAAAGLPSPAMSVYDDVRDLAGFAESCRVGRSLGFLGRATIHPAQLPVVVEAFTPGAKEVARAREVVAAAEAAAHAGIGALALPDGRFVDEAVVLRARRTLALADN